MAPSKELIEHILEMNDAGLDAGDIAEILYRDAGDSFFADLEDDSDEGIARRYCISEDDRFDIRGNALLPRLNDAGEPNWF